MQKEEEGFQESGKEAIEIEVEILIGLPREHPSPSVREFLVEGVRPFAWSCVGDLTRSFGNSSLGGRGSPEVDAPVCSKEFVRS